VGRRTLDSGNGASDRGKTITRGNERAKTKTQVNVLSAVCGQSSKKLLRSKVLVRNDQEVPAYATAYYT
jgi:hypothetical protein